MSLERLWAGWRSAYVEGIATQEPVAGDDCLLCVLGTEDPDDKQVIVRNDLTYAVLNAYPYCSGHMMVVPNRHVAQLDELEDAELESLWTMVRDATKAVSDGYSPDGMNVGLNLGRAAGGGIPGHLHVHVVPRWFSDTNFLTSVAEARVMPEALTATWEKLRDAWPGGT